MKEVECSEGQIVIKQDDPVADHFFVVRSGEFSVFLNQVDDGKAPVFAYKPGGTFGELALLYNKPRAATIKCTAPGVVYQLDRKTFQNVLVSGQLKAQDSSLQLLKKVPLLEGLTEEQYMQLTELLQEQVYEEGDSTPICEQGTPIDSLYIVSEGMVEIVEIDEKKTVSPLVSNRRRASATVVPYSAGDNFGASALADMDVVEDEDSFARKRKTWQGSVRAVGNATILRLRRSDIQEALGDLGRLLRDNFQQKILGSIQVFNSLAPAQLSIIVDNLTEQRYAVGDTIMKQGDEGGDTFYMIRSGIVRVSVKSKGWTSLLSGESEVTKLAQGDYFGEMALLSSEPRTATITAIEPTTCMTIDRETFTEVLGPEVERLLGTEVKRRKSELGIAAASEGIELASLTKLGALGVGAFGRVVLVAHKPTNAHYALKCMRKRQIIALQQVDHIMNEKLVLSMCSHPFLINIVGAFQDDVELYMLLELAQGGELFALIGRQDNYRFDEPGARFYVSCVVSAFTHMHNRHIVYRDLKPENLLIDTRGYIKICDFGFAKIVPERTFTLCGTPEYLAPEMIKHSGHTVAVDWWAVGVLAFECLSSEPPWMSDNPVELYTQIIKGEIFYPQFLSKNAKDFVVKLLVANPSKRLGIVKRGHRDLLEHPFLAPMDFTALVRRDGTKVTPPWVPEVSSAADTSNFDEVDEASAAAKDPEWDQPCTPEENDLFAGFSEHVSGLSA